MPAKQIIAVDQRQKGQAIPIGVASIVLTTVLVMLVFNTGQMTSEKTRLTNATDAAVYSGMVVQARTLNFMAYTNRAMVANQVAIGQMVTLSSWGRYAKQTADNSSKLASIIPYVGAALAQIIRTAGNAIHQATRTVAEVAATALNAVLIVLSNSQTVAKTFAATATPIVVHDVVKANSINIANPEYTVTFAGNLALANNASEFLGNNKIRQYKTNNYQNRQGIVVRNSRDGFTTDRRGTVFGRNGKKNIIDIGFAWFYLYREADTRFISKGNENSSRRSDLEWEWKAKDTLSIWVGAYCFHWRKGWYKCEHEVPLGWGSAYLSTNGRDFDRGKCFLWWCSDRWFNKNRTAERLANTTKYKMRAKYDGIQPYYSITDALNPRNRRRRRDPPPVTFGLGIEVERKVSHAIRTTANIDNLGSDAAYDSTSRNGISPGAMRLDDRYPSGGGLTAVARAEAYFKRPVIPFRFDGRRLGSQDSNARADRMQEYSNLFNPYWDVHLVEPVFERQAVLARRGVLSTAHR